METCSSTSDREGWLVKADMVRTRVVGISLARTTAVSRTRSRRVLPNSRLTRNGDVDTSYFEEGECCTIDRYPQQTGIARPRVI